MKKYILFLIVILSFTLLAKDPSWMVTVEKTTPNGGNITGTGYIVKNGDQYFVRTASHITLGTTEKVTLRDADGRVIPFNPSQYASDNSTDDMIIAIPGSDHDELGAWSASENKYIVNKDAYKRFRRDRERNYIENNEQLGQEYSAGFVSPERVDREDNYRNGYDPFGKGTYDNTGVYYSETDNLRDAKSGQNKIADFQVLPGESGSPLIQFENNCHSNAPRDLQGNSIKLPKMDDHVCYPYIGGHILNYHRSLNNSKFSHNDTYSTLDEYFVAGGRGSIDETEWRYENGLTYRVRDGVAETSFNSENSGNGTGVDTGNGTGVDTGNGTGVDTGNGTGVDTGNGTGVDTGNGTGVDTGSEAPSAKVNMGMDIDGEQVLAFELNPNVVLCDGNNEIQNFIQSNGHIAANWLNYQFLTDLQRKSSEQLFTPVATEDLATTLIARFERNGQTIQGIAPPEGTTPELQAVMESWMDVFQVHILEDEPRFCTISKRQLEKNILDMRVKFATSEGIQTLLIKQDLHNIDLLQTGVLPVGTLIQADLTGLFGVDVSAIDSNSNELKDKLYITLRAEGFKQENADCTLVLDTE
ncbi:MAG: hypothetical protein CME62_04915 [Halobacteriovoraceae bacterium]|nr:hypothetical protein [Halobacteriovoraceae bacterium]|tara:strand:+ start:2413 stop:4167 length:1755 start_codon:yes stop_codon:yes gene_type:complete